MTRRSALVLLLAASLCPASARGQQTATPTECSGATEPAGPPPQPDRPPPSPAATSESQSVTAGVRWRDLIAAALALLGAGAGLSYVVANERRRRGGPPARPLAHTPYVTGVLLGLLFAVSLVAFGRPVGASGGIQNLAGWLGHRLSPSVPYWGEVIPIGVTWQALVLVGVVLGGMGSAALAGRLRPSLIPAERWAETFGPSIARRWAVAFLGAALLEYSAAIAGGCTSGLALSGGIVLSPAAFLFIAAMFASGAATAWLIDRARRRPQGAAE